MVGGKVTVYLGVFAAKNIKKVQGSFHHRFPFVKFVDLIVPLLPTPPTGFKISVPNMPYLLDTRENEGGDPRTIPSWGEMLRAMNDLFRGNMAPHVKNKVDTMAEAMKKDWKKEVSSRYQFPVMTPHRYG